MRVEVKLFGPEARAVGADAVGVELDTPATCGDLRKSLTASVPSLVPSLASARFARNGRFAADDEPVAPGDELAIIGLVGGG